jgi:hypothetical protein
MKTFRAAERGIALITALWICLIGVMLVTTLSLVVQSSIMEFATSSHETRARLGAINGIQQMIAYLILDRPQGGTDTSGIILTEALLRPFFGNTVALNGVYVNSASDRIGLYNWGPKALDISDWKIRGYNNGGGSWIAAATAVPAATVIQPGEALWITADAVVNTNDCTIFLYLANGTTIVDTARITTSGSGQKIVCLPDGANQGGANDGNPWINDIASFHPAYGDTYYWGRAGTNPFHNVPAGDPGHLGIATNGAGKWLDHYRLEKHRGTTVDSIYVFPPRAAFLRYGMSLLLRNDLVGWPGGWTAGETQIITCTATYHDHTLPNADSVGYSLKNAAGTVISRTGSLDASNPATAYRWARTSASDPMTALVAGGAPTAGSHTASTISTPFISEVYDSASTYAHPYVSKINAGLIALGNYEAVELYNPMSTSWNLVTNPLRLFSQTANPLNVTLNSGSIPANGGFYLWTDSPNIQITTGVTADFFSALGGSNNIPATAGMSVGLYDATTGVLYDSGYIVTTNNTRTFERKSNAGSTNATMQVGGGDVNAGNAYDVNGTSADFVTHLTGDAATVQWKNSGSAPEAPPPMPGGGSVSGAEFIEISLGSAPTDIERRYEFIEVQNIRAAAVDLVAEQYWVAVDTPAAAGVYGAGNRRYLAPFHGVSSTLAVGAVGVIVASDADTPTIASLSNMDTSQIRWFGLRQNSGAGLPPTDTMLGKAGTRALSDAGEVVIVGYGAGGAPPGAAPFWYGVPFPPTPALSSDTSWRKKTLDIRDKNASPFDTFAATNWQLDRPNPGIGLGARSGYDGPPLGYVGALAKTDTWYSHSYDSFVLTDTNSYHIYYRARVFDEGGKVNLGVISGLTTTAPETRLFPIMLQQNPNPPFTTSFAYDASNAFALADSLVRTFSSSGGTFSLLTPYSPYILYGYLGGGPDARYRCFRTEFLPYVTVYGGREPNALAINVNTAETPALIAALRMATVDGGWNYYHGSALGAVPANDADARTRATSAANKIYNFITKANTNPADDTGIQEIARLGSEEFRVAVGLDIQDRDAMSDAHSDGVLGYYLTTCSNNYFTIYSTGFVFKKGANPATDTPIRTFRCHAVVRRSNSANTAEILYWREEGELAKPPPTLALSATNWGNDEYRKMAFPVGTWRHPWYKWDIRN